MGKVAAVAPVAPAAWAKGLDINIEVAVLAKFRNNPAAVRKILEAKRDQVVSVTQGFYGGMVKAVDDVLTTPLMRGFAKGGPMTRNVALATPNTAGLPQAVKMQIRGEGSWAALNPLYIKGELPPLGVVSKSYWRKTGDLARAFRTARPSNTDLAAFGKYARSKFVPRAKAGPAVEVSRALARLPVILAAMEVTIGYPAIRGNAEVDRLIRGSFASRTALRHVVTKGMISPGYREIPLNHLLLAESDPFARPWVAMFAAQMGVKYVEALRALAAK